MSRSKFSMIASIAFAMLTFFSCGGSNPANVKKGGGTKNFKSITGWKANDQKGWFFSPKQKKPKAWDGMVYVEGGSFIMGQVKDNVLKDWNNTPRRMQVRSFFIGETEVVNQDYRRYLTWLKFVFPPSEEQYKDIYFGSLPDSLAWRNMLSRNDIYADSYLRSAQFDYYPVVGVSWLQASNFCDWQTDRANERELMNKGILSKDYYTNEEYNQGSKHFNAERYKYNDSEVKDAIDTTRLAKELQIKNPNTRIQKANRSTQSNLVTAFRLPTEAEWEYAALGLQARRDYNSYDGKPVVQNEIRGAKGRARGQYLSNFKRGRGDYSGIGGYGNDGSAITSDVRHHPSNDIGIYGMYGNVAEWTADVYRPIIDDEGNDFNYYRGNIYTSKIKDPQGGFTKLQDGETRFDSLADGRFTYTALPGQYKEEVTLDARNFRDGDFQSSLDVGNVDPDNAKEEYYNSPKRKFIVDELGRVILEKDESQVTSEISDEIRVVKGGSWQDPIYWLDPGQRRFLHQSESASWIGFRVAQDYLGTSETGRSARGMNKLK